MIRVVGIFSFISFLCDIIIFLPIAITNVAKTWLKKANSFQIVIVNMQVVVCFLLLIYMPVSIWY